MEEIDRWFTPQQKAELWERWKSGQCVAEIARALEAGTRAGSIGFWRSMEASSRRRGGELR